MLRGTFLKTALKGKADTALLPLPKSVSISRVLTMCSRLLNLAFNVQ